MISRYLDYSGGQQNITSRLLQADNELAKVINGRYNKVLGGITRRFGFESLGTVESGNYILGLNSFGTKENLRLLVAADDSGDSETVMRYLNGSNFDPIYYSSPASAKLEIENLLDKAFVVGHDPNTNTFVTSYTIDNQMVGSTTDMTGAPKAKYIVEGADRLYMMNVEVGEKRYPDRVYYSSNPTDAITFVNTDQKGTMLLRLKVDSVRYLRAGMKVDIYGENSNLKKVDSLEIIGVDKSTNEIMFTQKTLDVSDRDEIYLEDQKDNLRIFWNTDYPNPDTSDYLGLKPVKNEIPQITGGIWAANRLWIFTEHSVTKYDGANQVLVSRTIGCLSHRSIKEIGGMIIFFSHRGFEALDPNSGQIQLISKPIQKYVDAIKGANYSDVVAMSRGNLYKAYVGEINDVDDRTTSTSTSSSSTSSTSTSTSSTSTSSTSTSLSSTSTSVTTTSTSTSTSLSTSTSTSTATSTSTSTTLETGIDAYVYTFDADANAWSIDEIDRYVKCSVNHQMHGMEKIYFGDHTGQIFRDETGYSDNGKAIHFLVETKRYNQDLPEETKYYRRVYAYTQNGNSATFAYSIDGGQWQTIGRLEKEVTPFDLPQECQGRDIAFRVSQNNVGEPVTLIGIAVDWERKGLELYGS